MPAGQLSTIFPVDSVCMNVVAVLAHSKLLDSIVSTISDRQHGVTVDNDAPWSVQVVWL